MRCSNGYTHTHTQTHSHTNKKHPTQVLQRNLPSSSPLPSPERCYRTQETFPPAHNDSSESPAPKKTPNQLSIPERGSRSWKQRLSKGRRPTPSRAYLQSFSFGLWCEVACVISETPAMSLACLKSVIISLYLLVLKMWSLAQPYGWGLLLENQALACVVNDVGYSVVSQASILGKHHRHNK